MTIPCIDRDRTRSIRVGSISTIRILRIRSCVRSPRFYEPGLDMWVVARFADVDAVIPRSGALLSRDRRRDPLTSALSADARTILAAGFPSPPR